jgi:hypothetical protein
VRQLGALRRKYLGFSCHRHWDSGFDRPWQIVKMLLNRRDDIVTTSLTKAVVMVVAAISPEQAWQQPLLRFVDTIIGIAAGVFCKWVASFAFYRAAGDPVR